MLGQDVSVVEQPWNKVFIGELNRIGYLVVRTLPLLLLFLIPVVNLIAPVLWAIFAAWGFAMEYIVITSYSIHYTKLYEVICCAELALENVLKQLGI